MNIQLIRHATLRIRYGGCTLLVDPMFSAAGSLPATPNTANQRPNPLVDLPLSVEEVLQGIDAVLVTHTHRDHLDDAAIASLPRHLLLFCQPEDEAKLKQYGFTRVTPIAREVRWEGIRFVRTGGRHGTGEIGEKMGPVSGFVLQAEDEPTLYIAGDTVWCDEVKQAVETHCPEVAVVFAGAAQFVTGGPITMTAEDIKCLAKTCPNTRILVAHMEAWNHCLLSRAELRAILHAQQLADRVLVPEDGESNSFMNEGP
jgi:L-ascorbate metabolism protein UlaG (beta-lactamase superfamily)